MVYTNDTTKDSTILLDFLVDFVLAVGSLLYIIISRKVSG